MQGRRYLLVAALVIGALAAVELATSGGGPDDGRRRAPALPAEVLTPPQTTIASLRGKPAVVNFWASWCGPCDKEAPELRRFSRDVRGRAALVGVDWNDELEGAREFIRKNRWSFPNLRDADGVVGNRWGLSGLPNTFVLDADGRIVKVLRGPQTVAQLEAAVRAAGGA
ncbi:MAG TPA: TlpA disulfide reductase family protein [Thermoleophilaceae bacterium]|nr:TlpA disulfide reductase family protein [Thermoleophilaceae bacterium]